MNQALSRTHLISQWTELFRRPPPKGLSTRLLDLAVAYEKQSKSKRRLKTASLKQLRRYATGEPKGMVAAKPATANRSQPGTRFIREWKGEAHIVDVTENGFVYREQSYRSLSAVAKRITGAHWSGPGQHEPIISEMIWDQTQNKLASQRSHRRSRSNALSPSLLKGLLFDENGERLSPSHSNKNGKRYRYYILHRLMQRKDSKYDGWHLPAHELEILVCDTLASFLGSQRRLASAISNETMLKLSEPVTRERISNLTQTLHSGAFEQKHKLLTQIVERATISTSSINLKLNITKLELLLSDQEIAKSAFTDFELKVPIKLQRRGVERKITILDLNSRNRNAASQIPDTALCRTIAKAHYWMQMLITGKANTVREIAASEGIAENEVSRRIQLAFLAPDIVEAILQGQQPNTLTAQSLIRLKHLPGDWDGQRTLLGFEQLSKL